MSVKSRMNLVNSLVPRCQLLLSQHGIPTAYRVPGSGINSWYHTSLSKVPTQESMGEIKYWSYYCNCYEVSDPSRLPMCKGNSQSESQKSTVCKHCLAAFKARALQKGKRVAFCDGLLHAIALSNMGGQLFRVASTQGTGVVWGVCTDKPKKTLEDRVSLLRGEVEEGID